MSLLEPDLVDLLLSSSFAIEVIERRVIMADKGFS
jgi:hypothetical protein